MINELKLDLACGIDKKEGFKGIDVVETKCTDYVVDLTQYPWPIESDSAEEIWCSHYVEHINHSTVVEDLLRVVDMSKTFEEFKENIKNKDLFAPKDGLIKFMNEVYRILKVGGKITVTAPYYASTKAFQDPTHVRFITEASFNYFNKMWLKTVLMDQYETDIKCDFDITVSYYITNEMTLKSEDVRQKAFVHDLNAIEYVIIELIKR